ncbi:C4-dicarboxylate ABC transporter substrate-binding protein [Natronospirillum operosum]|uniref:C4-dicarboxylate ABC transporter substrate-binding protein n=1 Tax=Natronospirillum operosum TaxID=2759953 RepID=A0A4Z0WFU7_9GAMM|nr:TRAP transporter substrate-binding protein [Natronospirillum operosum]TGG94031.1 C4-dicarboxylate ABC transporter substrate-binding protein [Natronospirillum operosum]
MKRLITAATAISLLAAGFASQAQAQTRWDLATGYGDGVHHTINIVQFADEVRAATDGELDITVHSGASLFPQGEIHRAVRTGQAQAGELLMANLGNANPIFEIDNIPFLASDWDSSERLWEVTRPAVEDHLASEGMRLLFAVPWPPQGFYTRESIADIDDLRGMRMRSYSPMTTELAVQFQAAPTTVQEPEIPQAFSTGMINAMVTSPATGVSSQAWDFVDHYTDVQAWIPKNMVFVNERSFSRLSEEHQAAVLELAAQAEARGWEMGIQETEDATNRLREEGMTVSEPTAELRSALEDIGEEMATQWAEDAGEAGQELLQTYFGE